MVKHISCVLSIMLLTIICCHPKPIKDKTLITSDSIVPVPPIVEDQKEEEIKTSEQDSIIIKKVKIMTYEKVLDRKSKFFSKYQDRCSSWQLSKEQIEEILLRSKHIDGQEFSYLFSVLPCYYKGEVIVNDSIKLTFEMNAGSYTSLYNSNVSFRLGYYEDKKFFIESPGIEDE